MHERKVSNDEFFRMVDVNNDCILDLAEIEEVVKIFSNFSRKEIHMIHNFFDIDNNGKTEKDEFYKQMKKA